LEKLFLIGTLFHGEDKWEKLDSLEELANLGKTAGGEVVEKLLQRRDKPDSRFFIGKGKVLELKEIANSLNINTFVFDEELTSTQTRNLEDTIDKKVIDRTELILDIFAQHAKTRAAKIEVELTQLSYRLSKLTRKGILLSRLGGGIGTRGPGEMKLEIDRRRIRERIGHLEKKLKSIEISKRIQRKQRASLFKVAIVGYTNAGKSSIMNKLTKANLKVEDKLFSTLDATTRVLIIPPLKKILLTDTVGFIRRLPHGLISSFHSTLEEAVLADLRLYMVDISHAYMEERIMAGNEILADLGASDKPTLYVFNKIDADNSSVPSFKLKYPDAVFASCKSGEGIDDLKSKIESFYDKRKSNNTS